MGPLKQPDLPWNERKVSRHFQLGEFACDHSRKPPALAVPQLILLASHFLEPLRDRFGAVTVISGCRSVAHNTKVGGASQSWHVWGERGRLGVACDFIATRGHPSAWFDFLDGLRAPGLGLYATHVHVDNRPGPLVRWRA